MRIAILGGGGAMGGIFGGYLARAGNDVTLIDVSMPAVQAINDNGLTIEEKDGSQPVIRVPATTEPSKVGPVDLIINFVKCYHTDAAVRAAAPMISGDTAVLSLQNGWGNAPRIAGIVGEDKVLVGLTYHGGTLLGPGRVKHPGVGMTYIGELSGKATPRLDKVIETFRAAQIETARSERILDEVWKKLALNACTLPVAGLLHFMSHELVAFDGAKSLMAAILKEVVAVAKAQGISLDYDERWAAITGLLEKAVGGKASMLQDVEARRQTEIEVINGAIVDAGKRTGVATPVNETMVWMIQAKQAHYLQAKA
ncbi:MAG: 2-dehydropantoate 2-reductase [Mesorhizobium sp.]|uniref:ketopantoate reductase family protein n=1 Tax=Mesorhizobium sp. TaxID=1871066 RepID=UPI000FE54E29|nr:2-dehydropantoate 2-reductase [Mesorhizobium sp.]RWG60987.1 MAG: 2-dehydropantoate 2-reductase [Mesorhizobium sp.]RWH30591.1 MAG: 2-dehydropantoate 2-reductase [Mesorhizobium sp.]RWH36628.1 MAG: 2-dehydropantoate 2-reductase [Mesorhizobium sp.]RWH47047.1 MAG: 2-dehydropantoate 2-reductase [Mesorhizobium sp.]RWI26347.1 MAG: 2-dehydropantoate 2-reductase [Mesorhizobium sp.]